MQSQEWKPISELSIENCQITSSDKAQPSGDLKERIYNTPVAQKAF